MSKHICMVCFAEAAEHDEDRWPLCCSGVAQRTMTMPKRCTCPSDRTTASAPITAYRRRPGVFWARWITARRITHYGPGEQIAWHWSDIIEHLAPMG